MTTVSELLLRIYTRSVTVDYRKSTNQVTSQMLSAYLGYCGAIEHLIIDNDIKRSLIVFEQADAAQTALLLTGGILGGASVVVAPLKEQTDLSLLQKLSNVQLASAKNSLTTPIDSEHAVFVSGLSAKATHQQLLSFFSFCGSVRLVRVFTDPTNQPFNVAVVAFDSSDAVVTACLLEGAVVEASPIQVVKYAQQIRVNADFVEIVDNSNAAKSKPQLAPPAAGSISARVAAMQAAGIDVGKRAIARARAFDDEHSVRNRASAALTQTGARASSAANAVGKAATTAGKTAFSAVTGFAKGVRKSSTSSSSTTTTAATASSNNTN